MKPNLPAKIKRTGEIVMVQQMNDSTNWKDEKGRVFHVSELDFDNVYPDYHRYWVEAATSAMAGLNASHIIYKNTDIVKTAAKQADLLVEEIKKRIES